MFHKETRTNQKLELSVTSKTKQKPLIESKESWKLMSPLGREDPGLEITGFTWEVHRPCCVFLNRQQNQIHNPLVSVLVCHKEIKGCFILANDLRPLFHLLKDVTRPWAIKTARRPATES